MNISQNKDHFPDFLISNNNILLDLCNLMGHYMRGRYADCWIYKYEDVIFAYQWNDGTVYIHKDYLE